MNDDSIAAPNAVVAIGSTLFSNDLPLALIPDAGHACYIEQAAATARLIRSALPETAA